MAYNNNVPLATQTKAQTQAPILNNFKYIETDLQVEHQFNTGATTEGVHKQCSMANQSTPGLFPGCDGVYYVSGGQAWFSNGTNQTLLSLNPTMPLYTPFTGRIVFSGNGTMPVLVGNPTPTTQITGNVGGVISFYPDATTTKLRIYSFLNDAVSSTQLAFQTDSNGSAFGVVAGWSSNILSLANLGGAQTIRYYGWYISLLNAP